MQVSSDDLECLKFKSITFQGKCHCQHLFNHMLLARFLRQSYVNRNLKCWTLTLITPFLCLSHFAFSSMSCVLTLTQRNFSRNINNLSQILNLQTTEHRTKENWTKKISKYFWLMYMLQKFVVSLSSSYPMDFPLKGEEINREKFPRNHHFKSCFLSFCSGLK